MSTDCVFCNIIKNEWPASCVYNDKKIIAFMDIKPITLGHVLVVPTIHHTNIHDFPSDEIGYLFKIVKKIADSIKLGLKADGIRIIQNNGRSAGQVIFHFHVHVIPKYDPSNPLISSRVIKNNNLETLDEIANRIRLLL